MTDSILAAGVNGIQNGINTVRRSADTIANLSTSDINNPVEDTPLRDVTEAIVDLQVGEQQVQASAAVVRTADEVLGTLIDTTA